jgi:hypothetical protein
VTEVASTGRSPARAEIGGDDRRLGHADPALHVLDDDDRVVDDESDRENQASSVSTLIENPKA